MRLLATSSSSSPLHFWGYFLDHQDDDLGWLWAHAWLSVVPVIIGLIIALPLGWIARRYRFTYAPLMTITGVIYTIPSIALFILIPPLLGLSELNPIQVPIALTLYSVALLVRVVADGLASVPEDTIQAATAIGFKPVGRFFKVELPIATPVIAAGLRVALVANVSIVAISATIGMSNLGKLFTIGFQDSVDGPYYPPIVLGILLCMLLALVLDRCIIIATALLTPWRKAVPS